MSSTTFLLALAAPAALVVTHGVVAATQAVGESFSDVLGATVGKSNDVSGDHSEHEPTIHQSLESLAASIRGWLTDQGIAGGYAVNYQLSADGESQVDVTGTSAEHVRELLAKKPSWLKELRQLAASWQAETASRGADRLASPARIEITHQESSFS
jgi:hypothetical protein